MNEVRVGESRSECQGRDGGGGGVGVLCEDESFLHSHAAFTELSETSCRLHKKKRFKAHHRYNKMLTGV